MLIVSTIAQSFAQDPAVPVDESNWPQLRGPAYDGISSETKLAESWPAEGPPVLWIRELGQGYSSFAAVDDRLYTQTQNLLGQYVVCLDAETGRTIWEHRYALPYEPAGLYPGPRSTPTYRDGRVYFATPDGVIGSLDATDGTPIWSVDVNSTFHGRGTDFGYSASPVVEDGKVIVPVGGKGASVVALSAADGSVAWASGDEPASYCSVLPISFRGRRIIVALLQNALSGFDLQTGELLWQRTDSQGYDEHAASPIYVEPFLMIASPFRNGATLYRVQPVESETKIELTPVWESTQLSNDVASSVAVGGVVYGFDLRDVQAKAHRPSRGSFRCLDWKDGNVRWSSDETGHCTVIAADGKLILFNDRGQLRLIRANSERYEELARADVFGDEICWTAPALHRKRLYLRTQSRAVCLFLGWPDELSERARESAVPASQIPKSSMMNLSLLLGGEREYLFDPPTFDQLSLWYVACIAGVFSPAFVLCTLAVCLTRLMSPGHQIEWVAALFWATSFALGMLATPIGNWLLDHYIFTWPAALFVALQVAVYASVRFARSPVRRERVLARLAGVFFCVVFAGYFWLCRQLSLHHEWAFLMGALPAFPLSIVAARSTTALRRLAWTLLALTVFYWTVGGWLLAKSEFGW